jgi:hypothetical protein
MPPSWDCQNQALSQIWFRGRLGHERAWAVLIELYLANGLRGPRGGNERSGLATIAWP